MRRSAGLLFALAISMLTLSACPDDPMNVPSDAGTMMMQADGGDAGPPPPECSCEDNEDCSGCIAHIGVCCYEDETIEGQAEAIAAACAANAACKACCNECKARSCAELKARGECPNLLETE